MAVLDDDECEKCFHMLLTSLITIIFKSSTGFKLLNPVIFTVFLVQIKEINSYYCIFLLWDFFYILVL